MKKAFIKFSSILMGVVAVCSMFTFTTFAAASTITYKGHTTGYTFTPGSEYTDTDLFDNYKNVMPGDVRSESVTIKNDYKGSDYVRVWMSALLHDESGNPISAEVLKELKADERKGDMTELEYMHDFLDQLTLTVWNGAKTDENMIYTGHPSSLEQGFEGDNVYLGRLNKGESMTLNVELSVDIEMGNEYADRIGEVDWIFLMEERNTPGSDPDGPGGGGGSSNPKPDPEDTVIIYPSDVPLAGPDELPVDQIGEFAVAPKTGDETTVIPYLILLGIGVSGMIVLMSGRRKKRA